MRAIFIVVGAAIGLIAPLLIAWAIRKFGPRILPPDVSREQWDAGSRRFYKAWAVIIIVCVAFGAVLGAVLPINPSS